MLRRFIITEYKGPHFQELYMTQLKKLNNLNHAAFTKITQFSAAEASFAV